MMHGQKNIKLQEYSDVSCSVIIQEYLQTTANIRGRYMQQSVGFLTKQS